MKDDHKVCTLNRLHNSLYEFPNLKGIFRAGIGKDNVPEAKAVKKGILVRYPSQETIDIIYNETASFTCSLILRMLYNYVGTIEPWYKYDRPELSRQTLLVIGTGNIGRSLKNRKIMNVFPDGEYGKHAVSHYKVLERFGYTTLIECKLETGRTHQIRVHFAYLGYPIVGDNTYGGKRKFPAGISEITREKISQFPRQALHASKLQFRHPQTGNKVSLHAPLPRDMSDLISFLKRNV